MSTGSLRDADRTNRTLTELQRLFREWKPGSNLKACIAGERFVAAFPPYSYTILRLRRRPSSF